LNEILTFTARFRDSGNVPFVFPIPRTKGQISGGNGRNRYAPARVTSENGDRSTAGPAQGPSPAVSEALAKSVFAIIGYGNQGRAHALNLRESGARVIVGARSGGSAEARAAQDGFEVQAIDRTASSADLCILSLPDEVHAEVWKGGLQTALKPGSTVGFLHGFSVHFGAVVPAPTVGVVLVAPKGPGHTVRVRYTQGLGVPALFAVHQPGRDDARTRTLGLAWAHGIGSGRAAIVETSFAAETETDLFGEQAVLCGGVMALAQEAYRALVEAGYPPALAYMECCQELKQVVDLMFERGLTGMRAAISNTAEFGAFVAQERIVDDALRARMRGLLADIRSGDFARRFQTDAAAGFPWLGSQRARADRDPIENAGSEVRRWMPWLGASSGRTNDA
jgi:ketol-acid reductoisomerase